MTTLEDISALILQSHDLDDTLRNIVNLVAKRMQTDVCSIYLLDADNQTLRLQASKGLSRKAVGKVTLRIGEGLTGMAAQKRHAIAIEEPQDHPRYRYFKETGEERFHSFLGIPLFDRKNPLGVIVLQTKEPRQFSKEEISALATIAFQVASIVVNARLLDSIHRHQQESQRVSLALAEAQQTILEVAENEDATQDILSGNIAYPGVAIGEVFPPGLPGETVADYIEAFDKMEDPYLRERAADMEDIGRRVLANLVGEASDQTLHLKQPSILVARQILPSDMATLDNEQILGIVTEAGEKNSHAVIMAKAMGIPAIVAVRGALKQIAPEDTLIVDANTGSLYINPLDTIHEEYQRLQIDQTREMTRLEQYRDQPALTADGQRVILRANIGLISDIEVAKRFGAEGVGLYRTEFPYMARGDFPNRQDQYKLYSRVVKQFEGQPVTIRTLDIGGDKGLPYFKPPKEENPFMGWRSVRVSLDNRDIFRTQIEAILMAGQHGPVRLLFPMISSLDETRACLDVIAEARRNLQEEGLDAPEKIPVGVMIEVPAAVRIVPQLAQRVDFFALGTNDLIQYLLAADRNNPLVNRYYDPLHPAVIQVLDEVSTTARSMGKGVSLCGEMATDPLTMLLLLGMGLREFSMPAPFIPRMKAFLKGVSTEQAHCCYAEIRTMDSSETIRQHLASALEDVELGY
ncbi:MAG: phosphoenolpyruvate--protein phosphotransferase [Desulfuromonadales bacterium]